MAYGYILEAEYESGYVHREDEQDHSPYVPGKNIYHDIAHGLPEQYHGKLVRFSIIGNGMKYDIDFTQLPDNARPIYYREMARHRNMATGEERVEATKHCFGYQYTDEHGKNVKEIKELS